MDLVSLLYEWVREEREKHKRETGVLWVTDLVRCPLKRDFEDKYPELLGGLTLRPSILAGKVAHVGMEAILERRLNGVAIEVEGERELEVEGTEIRVRGRIDAVVGSEGIELKTARADLGIPQKHHVDQARAYNWLFDLKGTVLLYITPDRITQYRIDERMDDSEVKERILSSEAPRYDWECGYCPYSVVCPKKRTQELGRP